MNKLYLYQEKSDMKSSRQDSAFRSKIVAVCIAAFGFALNACTTDQQSTDIEETDPVEEVAAPAEAGEAGAEPTAPSPEAAEVPGAPEGAEAVEETYAVPQTPTAPAASAPSSGPATGRRVMYVKDKSAVLKAAADANSKVVGKLTKGDHLVVTIEGDWARTDKGQFVSVKSLSEKGIGRKKAKARWSRGN